MRHFKHIGLGVATGLVVLLGGAYPASASDGGGTGRSVFRLTATQTQAASIDVDGSSGPSQGDEFVTSGNLLHGSTIVGTYGEICTITRTAPLDEFDLQCAGTFSLPQGQLTAQGRFTVTSSGPGTIDFAITGGTGSYRTARGVIHAVNVSQTETQLTVQLIR